MSCLTLTVDVPAGATIQDACKDAVALATRIGITIKIEFNDKIIFIFPNTNVNSLVLSYKEAVRNNFDFVCSFDKDI